ncbi:hypothetical protein BD779DRAFT_1673001 [Infundibulicybe gibba]|nr:hypothetical protein BD779DRAFT_1673001 [Infundibulicybe gibba]
MILEPLVRVPQLKGHLTLLKAFVDLRTRIENLDATTAGDLPHLPAEKERRWTWFVGIAVERFERWCLALTPGMSAKKPLGQDLQIPPLDVIMVFHSYLLNPLWFWEDCSRFPELDALGDIAGLLGKTLEMAGVFTAPPTFAAIRQWIAMTSTPFDYLESAADLRTRTIYCPKCSGSVSAALMNADGTGYLQEKFSMTCPHCSFASITKESLAVRQICRDLISQDSCRRSSLAGTLYTPAGLNSTRAQLIKQLIMRSPKLRRPNGKDKRACSDSEWLLHMTAKVKYSFKHLRIIMASNMRANGGRLLGRILSAYSDDKIFSVDLTGAVLRQGSFITKMHDLGWTEPQFFDRREDEVALEHTIARYHAFLDLMASSPASFFVPTLDIDLAWHTHQLTAEHYKAFCMEYVGRFIDHDDKVEAGQLSSAFDITCRAWKASQYQLLLTHYLTLSTQNKFNVEYTHCGCPLPGQTIGQKLSRLVNRYAINGSYLIPPAHDSLLAATHPSDHNAVLVAHHRGAISAQKRRRKKFERRREREAQDALKGKADPKRSERGAGHDPAFLVPVPMFYTYGAVPIIPGCTAYTASVVSGCAGGSGICAAGAGTCGGGGASCGGGSGGGGGCGGGDGGGGSGGCGGGGGGGGGCGGGGGGN